MVGSFIKWDLLGLCTGILRDVAYIIVLLRQKVLRIVREGADLTIISLVHKETYTFRMPGVVPSFAPEP